ncbi:MAG: hypothetical protein ACQSGP_24060 [Frankia sp.]
MRRGSLPVRHPQVFPDPASDVAACADVALLARVLTRLHALDVTPEGSGGR